MSRKIPSTLLILGLCLMLRQPEAQARAFEVRLLKGTERDGVWGTDEFRVSVNWTGVVRHVIVKDKELIWQAAALYTFPVPPEGGPAPRTVQGEGSGNRGLSIEPPKMECRDEKGKRVFTFHHQVSSKKIHDGKPLCNVLQKIVITPTGEISVAYDFEWTETVRWYRANRWLPSTAAAPATDDEPAEEKELETKDHKADSGKAA